MVQHFFSIFFSFEFALFNLFLSMLAIRVFSLLCSFHDLCNIVLMVSAPLYLILDKLRFQFVGLTVAILDARVFVDVLELLEILFRLGRLALIPGLFAFMQ